MNTAASSKAIVTESWYTRFRRSSHQRADQVLDGLVREGDGAREGKQPASPHLVRFMPARNREIAVIEKLAS